MNKLNNKEFRLSIVNLVAAEEHVIEMMYSAEDEKTKKMLFDELKNIKAKRNILLTSNAEEERDLSFNKWCLMKHLMLAQYHLLEWTNQSDKEFDEVQSVLPTIKSLDDTLNKISSEDIKTDCKICPEDLIIPKIIKTFLNR